MKRFHLVSMLVIFGLFVVTPSAQGQTQAQKPEAPSKAADVKAEAKKEGKGPEWKIKNAMSAAPASIAKAATIMDYPAKEGAEPTVLRKGTNEWTCFPDDPSTPANDPMCLDKMSMAWAQAWMTKQEPKLTAAGIGYMLQGGGSASNTDPFAKKPAAGEKWMKEPPHVMIFSPGKLDPKVYTTDPHSGGPWIMWAGTPYEHLMVPVK
jgi:hypothetical protein